MQIRPARHADIPGLLALLLQVGQVHHEIRPDVFRAGASKYDGEALSTLLEDPERPIFVAEEEGQLLGYCFCVHRDYDGTGIFTRRQELYIDDLCIDGAHRGTGIAGSLYRHACAYAKERGCRFVTLNVWCGNDGAMGFYEKMGLRPRNIMMETVLE